MVRDLSSLPDGLEHLLRACVLVEVAYEGSEPSDLRSRHRRPRQPREPTHLHWIGREHEVERVRPLSPRVDRFLQGFLADAGCTDVVSPPVRVKHEFVVRSGGGDADECLRKRPQ